jgi:hypothetical protein
MVRNGKLRPRGAQAVDDIETNTASARTSAERPLQTRCLPSFATANRKQFPMSERLETLQKARARMTDDRDAYARTLAAPFDRDKAERARLKFIETQGIIDALDRAIAGEAAAQVAAD